jgi:filamentous hemagglutinin
MAHEARGGHTIARHVGRGIVDLSQRLHAEPGLRAASSFVSRAAAERGVASGLAQNADEIGNWLSGSAGRLVVDGDLASGLGHVLKRGELMSEAATGVRIVLDRAPGTELGYIIKTAYPTSK